MNRNPNETSSFLRRSFTLRMTPVRLGVSVGVLLNIVLGLVYLVVLRESGSAFYVFAGLAFLGCPFLGGVLAASKAHEHKFRAFFSSSGIVFVTVFMLFFLMYAVLPQFARTNVQLPAFCDGFDGSFNPPTRLTYTLPDAGTGVMIASDSQSAVVVIIDSSQPPFPSTVYLVNKSDNKIIQTMRFGNDVISATIDEGILYIYNDKLGYLLDAHTGEFEENFLLIDNYGGLSETDRPILLRASSGHWYMETTAVISSWNVDGSVRSRPHLTFNGIALGCFISGDTQEVTQL